MLITIYALKFILLLISVVITINESLEQTLTKIYDFHSQSFLTFSHTNKHAADLFLGMRSKISA